MTPHTSQPGPFTGKNIIVCCDGTGNKFIAQADPDNSNSNVVKLYSTLRIGKNQIAYYRPGVGTGDDPNAEGWMQKLWFRIRGLAFGKGFASNVLDAYRYLMDQYSDGDRVYIVGFSRGAYTARALAGLLDGYGLLCQGNEGHLQYAWNDYVAQHNVRDRHQVQVNFCFKETFSRRKFRIHFLGIWDTVSSVGWINTPLRLFNIASNATVRIGRHAVSIDERRCFYRDNLWHEASQAQLDAVRSEDDPQPGQDLLTVWFPGVHSDIGGSYSQATSGLSNIALEWLLDQARAAGADIKPHMEQLVLGQPITSMPDPVQEPDEITRIQTLKPLYAKPSETEVHHSLHGIWWLLELLPHRYYDKDDGKENWRTPLGMYRRLPDTKIVQSTNNPINQPTYIHRTAWDLMQAGTYRPPNVIGGQSSLSLAHIAGQEPDSLYLYSPPAIDAKPFRNEALVRWSVMIAVTAADLVVAGSLLGAGLWALASGVRALRRL